MVRELDRGVLVVRTLGLARFAEHDWVVDAVENARWVAGADPRVDRIDLTLLHVDVLVRGIGIALLGPRGRKTGRRGFALGRRQFRRNVFLSYRQVELGVARWLARKRPLHSRSFQSNGRGIVDGDVARVGQVRKN